MNAKTAATLLLGAALGACLVLGGNVLNGRSGKRSRGSRVKESSTKRDPANILRSVTRFLFVTTQIFALAWVSVSYGIAVYSTVVLMQPFPVVELSQQAIDTILKVSGLKVLENIFEHNEGKVFGTSKGNGEPPDAAG